jgi:hypothetical protein
MPYNLQARQESHPTFLHPNGLPEDPAPYVTGWGLILPGVITSTVELEDLIDYVQDLSAKERQLQPLPSAKQLGRIALAENTGCWQLPIYKDGLDTHADDGHGHKAGSPRARYGSMMVKGANDKPTDHLAHRTMYRVMRGPIPEGYHIDHLCRNPRCCYHRHLEAVDAAENIRRAREAKLRIGIE